MVLNRGIALKNLFKVAQKTNGGVALQSIRNSGDYVYRNKNVPYRRNVIMAEAIGAFMWWWIFHHLFTEPGHIVGEFPYPDPSKWTDAELGIPPDDE